MVRRSRKALLLGNHSKFCEQTESELVFVCCKINKRVLSVFIRTELNRKSLTFSLIWCYLLAALKRKILEWHGAGTADKVMKMKRDKPCY